MSGISSVCGETLRAVACLFITCLLVPVASHGADDQEPKKTLPIQVTVSVNWDIEGGGTRNEGSMTMRLRGTANLAEEVSVMDPGAPPGVMITYGAGGVGGHYTYRETVTQEKPPQGCPEVMAEYEGNGVFQIEEINSAMTSGLNIRKMGSLIPKEMLQFVPPEAKEMMIDYYDFFAVARKQKAPGRRRGWNDCNFVDDTREFNPTGLTIRFQITDEGKMTGSRRWSVEKNSGGPSFNIRISDLPQKMERRPLVPEPGEGGDVTYAVNWHFGEVDPYVEIQRREGEFWIPLPGDEPVEVIAGEKMELRGIVLPEEKDPKTGEWTISGDGGSGGKMYIKKYDASHQKGEVVHIDPQKDLRKPEVLFFWVNEGTGTVEYTTTAGTKQLKDSVEFEVKKPQFAFYTEASPRNKFGVMNVGTGHPGAECCMPKLSDDEQKELDDFNYRCKELQNELASLDPNNEYEMQELKPKILKELIDLGCTPRGIQYEGISFIAEPEDDISGEVQFVQLLSRSIMVESDAGTDFENLSKVLDGCYPYPKNISYYATLDAPGYSEQGETSYQVRQLDFEMFLMFRPDGEGNEWIPLKRAVWTWAGAIRCDGGACAEDEAAAVIPTSEQVPDHSEYPEWTECSMGG
jgi:hypothetical protein